MKNKRTTICTILKRYELNMKDFAHWLDMTPEGLSRSVKRQEGTGEYSKLLEWSLKGFLIESGKGDFTLEHRAFND